MAGANNAKTVMNTAIIRLKFSVDLKYEIANQASDFIFNIHAAQTERQMLVGESLEITPVLLPVVYPDPSHGTRFMRLTAGPGAAGHSIRRDR